jgi:uncharacterized protein (DUF1330 family)
MRSGNKSVLILGLGVALGLAASTAIRAQQTKVPDAYLIAETTVTDAATFKNYAKQAPATLAPFGGKFLVLPGKVTPLEGDPPKGEVVIIAFESVQKALDWYNSPAHEAIRPIRQKSAKTRNFIVEGVMPQ